MTTWGARVARACVWGGIGPTQVATAAATACRPQGLAVGVLQQLVAPRACCGGAAIAEKIQEVLQQGGRAARALQHGAAFAVWA